MRTSLRIEAKEVVAQDLTTRDNLTVKGFVCSCSAGVHPEGQFPAAARESSSSWLDTRTTRRRPNPRGALSDSTQPAGALSGSLLKTLLGQRPISSALMAYQVLSGPTERKSVLRINLNLPLVEMKE